MRKALAFLTPFGGPGVPSPGTLNWFPVVGAALGLAVGGVWWSAGRVWAPTAAAAVALLADVVVTGFLHLDGVADAGDGLLAPMTRQRRLEVMADPAVGAFGAISVCVVLVLRFGAFASTAAAPLVVGALWCASRAGMAVTARCMHYARPGGLASAFLGDDVGSEARPAAGEPVDEVSAPGRTRRFTGAWWPGLLGAVVAAGMAIAGRGTHALAAVGAELVAMAMVLALAQKRIGGFTGDVLGAAGVVGETVGLLVLAAKW